tara:strand:- start:2224 stop:2487 length:264 start_codon:yes stop_codon:yes gene_type:complete
MNYTNGDTVVVNIFGTLKVGKITEKQKTVKGNRYIVHTEDGRINEDLYVDNDTVMSFIDSRLTKSFNKAQEQSNKLIDDTINIVNNK